MYTNKTLGAMDLICPSAEQAGLGTVVDALVAATGAGEQYTGALLSADKVSKLNNMCFVAKEVQLGTVINDLLTASKNGTSVVKISDAYKALINKMCAGVQIADLGGVLQSCADIINTHGALSDAAEVSAFTIALQTGDSVIDGTAKTIDITMPMGTSVEALVATFTISENATIEVNNVAQVSGVTANNFTTPVVYTVTSQSEDVVEEWTVTVTVATE